MKQFITCLLLLVFYDGRCQELIKGKIIDNSNQEPLVGAMVVSGVDTTITDVNGRFTIEVSEQKNYLHFKHLGYSSSIKNIKFPIKSSTYEFDMSPASFSLNEVVIMASAQNGKLKNASAGISIVSKEMIQRDDPFTMVNALNRIPGLYMHSGTFNTNRLTIRGIGSRSLFGTDKIKAYYGQIPLTDGSGNSTIEDIDQGLIERVEVHKGPNSSLYGAGLAGVVQLSPFRPTSYETSLETQLTIGDFNTLRWMGRLSHSDEKLAVAVTHAQTESRGYRENNSYNRQQTGINGSLQLSDNTYLEFFSFFTQLTSFIPSAITETAYINNPKSAAPTWAAAQGYESYDRMLLGATLHHDFNEKWQVSSTLFYTFRDAYEPRPFNILTEKTTSIGTRTFVGFRQGDFRWTGGVELFHDVYDWGTFENLYTPTSGGSVQGEALAKYQEKRNYANFFMEASQKVADKLLITAGLNFNATTYQLEDLSGQALPDLAERYAFAPVLSPRLGLSLPLSPSQTIFTNISHGFSPPTLDETLAPDGSINPNIRPESGWNFETGLRGTYKSLSYDANLYFMTINNLLVAQRTGDDAYIGVNAGLNHHTGLDLALNYHKEFGTNQILHLFTTFSYMHYRFIDFVDDGEDFSGNQLTGVPNMMFYPGIEWLSRQGPYANLTGQYVSEIPINDSNELFADEYFVVRGKMGFKKTMGSFSWDIHAGVNNLANTKYASMLLINATAFGNAEPRFFYPGLPRHFYGGFNLKYVF